MSNDSVGDLNRQVDGMIVRPLTESERSAVRRAVARQVGDPTEQAELLEALGLS